MSEHNSELQRSTTLLQRFAAFTFYTSIATLLYLATSRQVPVVTISNFDKFQHFAAFGWLTVVAYVAWRQIAIQRFAIIFLISLSIEFAQLFISYRSASWFDLIANATGIVAAEILIIRQLKRFLK